MLAASDPEKNDSVLAALQLGWLAVEAFGLLRRYALHGKPPSPEKVDATQRFNFTERDPNLYEQLLISMQMLKAIAARLTPDLIPPVPDDLSKLLEEAKKDINPYWSRFEDWSRQLWNQLQITDPLAGQAFTCGGDLADTYWYAQGAGAGKTGGDAALLPSASISLNAWMISPTSCRNMPPRPSITAWNAGASARRYKGWILTVKNDRWSAWSRRSRCGATCCSGSARPAAT